MSRNKIVKNGSYHKAPAIDLGYRHLKQNRSIKPNKVVYGIRRNGMLSLIKDFFTRKKTRRAQKAGRKSSR